MQSQEDFSVFRFGHENVSFPIVSYAYVALHFVIVFININPF